jgi:Asp-tRNA(Asn)/Glu-tRNA(Gln) amidotransferase A subunit family amidase
MDTAFLGIAELGRLYRDGSLTPREAVEQALDRLAQWEPQLNAFAHVMADGARGDADRLGAELQAGRDRGPLHGVPVAIKDLIEVAGEPTGFGSKVRPPAIATRDALPVARLREAGAIIIGKTNLLEYAYGVAHPAIGQTNNPHDPTRTAGGSSGGSAAAVAAGIVPLAIGTDTGGSIRIPAAYCGIVGLKPSFGLVPLDGVFPLSWTLDHGGPLTRGVADNAVALACVAGVDITLLLQDVTGLRIGIVKRHMGSRELTAGVRAVMDAALAGLRARGAILSEIDIPELADANHALGTILRPEASVIHTELLAENAAGYAPQTRAQIEAGFAVSAADYMHAMRFREAMRENVEACFDGVDVLLSPSVPFVAPYTDPVIEDGEEGEMLSSGLANLTGHPALNLPAGMSEGLPVGLQLMGPVGRDAQLLSVARAIEAALPAAARPRL